MKIIEEIKLEKKIQLIVSCIKSINNEDNLDITELQKEIKSHHNKNIQKLINKKSFKKLLAYLENQLDHYENYDSIAAQKLKQRYKKNQKYCLNVKYCLTIQILPNLKNLKH